ncbi:MAG: thiamine phosphate synthase [Candidatus Saganbacteria bacterium]|nr:thiamine phosphate synthase [Candidatus Saganbacteria bacterium]
MKSNISRIVDVNINRAVEGVRVMEELARFVLDDKAATLALKNIRTTLRAAANKLTRKGAHFEARKSLEDIGRKLYTKSEACRKNLLDIFVANAKRVQEALRVLEEFSKLSDPSFGKFFKDIRFGIYDIEKQIYYLLVRRLKMDFDLYLVTDPMVNHLKVVREAIAGGIKVIQLRDKNASKKQLLEWAKKIRKLTFKAEVIFIVNDYPDIAAAVDADGVHLGQEDIKRNSIDKTRKKLGKDKIIGVSTHNIGQALRAVQLGADYIAVGPIFATPTKPSAKPVGLKLLRKVLRQVKIPVVAIGGINSTNIYDVGKTGCMRVAVVRAVLKKKNMKKAVKDLSSYCR